MQTSDQAGVPKPQPVGIGNGVAVLQCPVCAGRFRGVGATLICSEGHRFDVARQGYVTLTRSGIRYPGDTTSMVLARERVHQAGWFAPLTQWIVEHIDTVVPADNTAQRCVVEVGAGTGTYLGAALDGLRRLGQTPVGIALDVSVPASKRAAKHRGVTAVRCDVAERIPLADHSVDAAMIIFAPRPVSELYRVLKPDGTVLVAFPTTEHLRQLRSPLGALELHPDKDEAITAQFQNAGFTLDRTEVLRWSDFVSRRDAVDLVAMGPTGSHATADELHVRAQKLDDETPVTFAVKIARWKPF